MKIEKVRRLLKESHKTEKSYNKEMGLIDKQIRYLNKKKSKLSKNISSQMKFRNRVIKKYL